MKKVGIALDDWKVPIFLPILEREGYTGEVTLGVTPNTRFIYVKCEQKDLRKMKRILERCQRKAAESKFRK